MLKTLWTNNSSWLFSAFVGIFFGTAAYFLFAIPFHYYNLTVNPQLSFSVDPVNLLSLFITSALAIYVLRVLNRKDDGDKVERDLLIGYFNKFEEKFSEEIHQITAIDGIEGSVLASTLKKHGMFMQELIELAKSHPSKNETNLSNLEQSVSEIRELLTNTPKVGEVEDGISLRDGRLFYSIRHVGNITASMGKFKKAVFSVIVDINRS